MHYWNQGGLLVEVVGLITAIVELVTAITEANKEKKITVIFARSRLFFCIH